MMSCARLYVEPTNGPDGLKKENQAYKPYKAVMREHEGKQFIIYIYNNKGWQSRIQKDRNQALKQVEK